MADDKHNDDQNLFDKLIAVLLRQSWLDVLGGVGKIVRKVVQGRSYRGMYEVLVFVTNCTKVGALWQALIPAR
jgi:hypothetical protein